MYQKRAEQWDFGAYPCVLKEGSLAKKLYGKDEISERHRHRFEFNNDYREICEENGLKISGTSPDGTLVEMVEYTKHLYMIAFLWKFCKYYWQLN